MLHSCSHALLRLYYQVMVYAGCIKVLVRLCKRAAQVVVQVYSYVL